MRRNLALAIGLGLSGAANAEPIERGRIEVVDGDTIRVDGQRVRLVGIDAPETRDVRCDAEKQRGEVAAQRLRELLDAGSIDIDYRMRLDRYQRPLARLLVNGEDVGAVLVRERLAVRYYGRGPKMDWCPRSRR